MYKNDDSDGSVGGGCLVNGDYCIGCGDSDIAMNAILIIESKSVLC